MIRPFPYGSKTPTVPCDGCGVELTSDMQVHRLEDVIVEIDDDEEGLVDVEITQAYCYACTWLHNREQVVTELRHTVEAIREAQRTSTFNDLWRHGNEALMWLYMIDNQYESHPPRRDEYKERKAAEAPVLLGLIWVRGAAQHGSLWELDRRDLVRMPRPQDRFPVSVSVWKAHPEDKKRKLSERTLWQHYDKHVANHDIELPLIEAERFVSALGESFWFPPGVDRTSRR